MKVSLKFDHVNSECEEALADLLVTIVDSVLCFDRDDDYSKASRRLFLKELSVIIDDYCKERLDS